jgi:hypothetical protein
MNSGYITLLSVLVVGAIGVAVATSLLVLGVSSSRSSFAYQQMYQAQELVQACAEEGLEQIRIASAYTGSGSVSAGQGVCTYSVTSQGGELRTLDATSTVGSVVRKTKVVLSAINPLLVVSSWQEVQ